MQLIRCIWERWSPISPAPEGDEIRNLLTLEAETKQQARLSFAAAQTAYSKDLVEPLEPLFEAAMTDFVAGCELARTGYMKQAYSLWRAWFEEMIFVIYFIEAPMHRLAWRSVDQITVTGKEPPVKLMLHQVLGESGGNAHPFGVVYAERFESIFSALKVTLGKKASPLKMATQRLSDLSQGVHGTFRPKVATSAADLPNDIKKHALSVVIPTAHLLGMFWFVCVASALSISETSFAAMKEPSYVPPEDTDSDEHTIAPLLPQLRNFLSDIKG